jgi:hypothetical protein
MHARLPTRLRALVIWVLSKGHLHGSVEEEEEEEEN